MKSPFVLPAPMLWSLICATALLSVGRGACAQTADSDMLSPRKGYVRLGLSTLDGRGLPQAPDVRFYTAPDLAGPPVMRLDVRGLSVRGQLLCAWGGGTFPSRVTETSPIVLRSVGHDGSVTDADCRPDVPIKVIAENDPAGWAHVMIEIAELHGRLLQVRYRGTPLYLNLHSVPHSSGYQGYVVELPRVSPPLFGVVDIPHLFRRARGERPAIALRRAPRPGAATVTTISDESDLELHGLGSGTNAAAVYARSGRWSLVQLVDGRRAWLAPEDSGKYASYERLLRNNASVTYLTGASDGTLAAAPGSRDRMTMSRDPHRNWIGYLEAREQARIRLLDTADPTAATVGDFDAESPDRIVATVEPPTHSRTASGERIIVFSRRPGWFEIALDDSEKKEASPRAWIEDTAIWEFHAVSNRDEADRLLSAKWPSERNPAVTITEVKRVAGKLWLRVQVFSRGACEIELFDIPRVVLGEGWIPAHSESGSPMVWFETYCD